MMILEAATIVSIFMASLWLVQLLKGEADVVDLGWTISLGFLAVWFSLFTEGAIFPRLCVAVFGFIWALRLGTHLFKRVMTPGEDGRYIALRESWGKKAQAKFFIFFQAQALIAILLAVSFYIPLSVGDSIPFSQALFAAIWFTLCITGEAFADKQLAAWRSNEANHGRTCRGGLWRYSRHPNYFFEWLYWFSYTILCFGHGWWWWLTVISPMFILFLILKVTGIPPTEERALKSRGEDYRDYQRTTSAFVPWFVKA